MLGFQAPFYVLDVKFANLSFTTVKDLVLIVIHLAKVMGDLKCV
jgi:hypothetical protein